MGSVHVLHSTPGCRAVERQLKTAQHLGLVHPVTSGLAILAVVDGQRDVPVAMIRRMPAQTGAAGVRVCGGAGITDAPRL